MKKLIFSSLFMLLGLTSVSAQSALQNEILEVANRTNNYFMTKYSDPTRHIRKENPHQQPLDSCRILRGIDGTLRD